MIVVQPPMNVEYFLWPLYDSSIGWENESRPFTLFFVHFIKEIDVLSKTIINYFSWTNKPWGFGVLGFWGFGVLVFCVLYVQRGSCHISKWNYQFGIMTFILKAQIIILYDSVEHLSSRCKVTFPQSYVFPNSATWAFLL